MKYVVYQPTEVIYRTVAVFAQQLADALVELGHEAELIPIHPEMKVPLPGEVDQIFSFCLLPHKPNGVPFTLILVDHPFYSYQFYTEPIDGLRIACVDRTHVTEFPILTGRSNPVHFLPHASGLTPVEEGKRPIDVLFTGTLHAPDRLEGMHRNWPAPVPRMIDEMLELSRQQNSLPFLEAFTPVLAKRGLTYDSELIHLASRVFEPWDKIIRQERRLEVLQQLDDAGIAVDIYGMGWQGVVNFRHHRLHGRMPFEGVERLMQQAKVVLNIGPNFPDGSHERPFAAFLAGAAVVSDHTPFWNEAFGDELLTYKFLEIERVPSLIRDALSRHAALAEAGRAQVLADHTWLRRAEQLIQLSQ